MCEWVKTMFACGHYERGWRPVKQPYGCHVKAARRIYNRAKGLVPELNVEDCLPVPGRNADFHNSRQRCYECQLIEGKRNKGKKPEEFGGLSSRGGG